MPDEHIDSDIPSAERQSFLKLTRDLAGLPFEQSAAALETSAAIGGVSLRAGIAFLRAAPEAATVLAASELHSWGELGRRLALADVETAITFFAEGVDGLKHVPAHLHPLFFQVCARQVMLSSAVAVETLRGAHDLAAAVNDQELLRAVLEVAAEIARRSAKHSAEFLQQTPAVLAHLRRLKSADVVQQALELAAQFATRAGGIAADAWATLPAALATLNTSHAVRLLQNTVSFLERGGGSALQVLNTGGDILRTLPEVFDDWIKLLWTVAQHGNASLIAFVRSSPRFVRTLGSDADHQRRVDLAARVLNLTGEIADRDGEAALACFRSSPLALRTVTIEQFEQWARHGLTAHNRDARARRSYFALETRGSYDALRSDSSGLALAEVRELLQLYVEGLTGRAVEISPLAAVPVESRIGDGRTIQLPSAIAEFGDDELNFRLYKVLAAHAAGQIEFGTYESATPELCAVYETLAAAYAAENADARAAFSLPDEMVGPTPRSVAAADDAIAQTGTDRNVSSAAVDYRRALQLFPQPQLARRIFGTLENGRIDRRLREQYRGLTRDLDLIREHLRRGRPSVLELPATLLPFELLFQTTLLGGASDDARQFYGQIVSELETVTAEYLSLAGATVADTLLATSRVYAMFQSLAPPDDSLQEVETQEEQSDTEDENSITTESFNRLPSERNPQKRDARELFNAWNDPNGDGEPDELAGAEAWTEADFPEQEIEAGEVAYNYDEWDRELTDHRLGWCRVIEKRVKHGDKNFVAQTRKRHQGVISSIRHQFQLLKPEDLQRVTNELDGEEFDLSAVVDFVIDRRAARSGGGHQSERLYTRRLRRRRDVTVSFLLDQSSSTARTIGRHPLQPYTRPGRRIIEIEKEGLVLMSEALEAVGDTYAINGFTSEGRRNVKFYVVKDFNERYSDEVKERIGGITFQNNTRLGAAIRHATAKLALQAARTRLLIVLSDGRPYDHDYGDARYAREDTREALRQAKHAGITPFCITIDRESEAELRDLYGEVGYTIIDDVLSLPERMPGIYRRLTT